MNFCFLYFSFFIVPHNCLSRTLSSNVSSPIVLDFDFLDDHEIRNIEDIGSKQEIHIQNTPDVLYIGLIGSTVKIIDKDNNIGYKLTPGIDDTIIVNITGAKIVKIYCILMSNILLTTSFKINIFGSLKLELLPSAWEDYTNKIDIYQYGELILICETKLVPVRLGQMIPTKTKFVGKLKSATIPYVWGIQKEFIIESNFSNPEYMFTSIAFLNNTCSIHSSYQNIDFGSIHLKNATLHAEDYSLFLIRGLKFDTNSYVHAGHVNTMFLSISSANSTDIRLYCKSLKYRQLTINTMSGHSDEILLFKTEEHVEMNKKNISVIYSGSRYVSFQPIERPGNLYSLSITPEKARWLKDILLTDSDQNITYNESSEHKQFHVNEIQSMYEYIAGTTFKVLLNISVSKDVVIELENISQLCDVWIIRNVNKQVCPTLVIRDDGYFKVFDTSYLKLVGKINAYQAICFLCTIQATLNVYDFRADILPNSTIFISNASRLYLEISNTSASMNSTHIITPTTFISYDSMPKIDISGKNSEFNLTEEKFPFVTFDGQFRICSNYTLGRLTVGKSGKIEIMPNTKILSLFNNGMVKFTKNNFIINTSVLLNERGTIESDEFAHYKLRYLALGGNTLYDNSSLSFTPNIINFGSSSSKMMSRILASTIFINQTSLSSIDAIENVSEIRISYSIQKSGYLYANRIAEKKNSLGKTRIQFINYVTDEQPFFGHDDFVIDILCAKEFDINTSNLELTFSSRHWQFSGNTRLFDMSIRNYTDKTCITLIRKAEQQENVKMINVALIVIGAGVVVLFLAAIIIVIIVKSWRTKNRINTFISDSSFTMSLITANEN